ncbi:MAG: SMP-30/gluconolactonase/LRE family protein [Methanobacteriota archaeon]
MMGRANPFSMACGYGVYGELMAARVGRNRGTFPLAMVVSSLLLGGCITRSNTDVETEQPSEGRTAGACMGGTVETFAQVPAPGHPTGVAARDGSFFVATSNGEPWSPTLDGERIFRFDAQGVLTGELRVDAKEPTMGLADIVFDPYDPDALYIVDMNGRILRSNASLAEPSVVAEMPPPDGTGGWLTTMPVSLAVVEDGTIYLGESSQMQAERTRIWRIPPGGDPEIWFEDPRLGGVTGGFVRVGPDGFLYFSVGFSMHLTAHHEDTSRGAVWRLPLVDEPRPDDLELFHRFEAATAVEGLAFDPQGRLYVALPVEPGDAIVVLDRNGTELDRYASPLFDSPAGMVVVGPHLYITNSNILGPENEDHWKILRMCIGEPEPAAGGA